MSDTTYAQAIDIARRRIARLDARLLLQHVVGCTHAELLSHPETVLSQEYRERFYALVKRRERSEPVAYLTGEKEFFGRSFKVTPAVLIPRPETELLVVLALERMKPLLFPRVADIGTGSGVIAVSLACECPDATVTAVDVSPAALETATANAEAHKARVRLLQSDWFSALGDERFDIIVSNPPYVADGDPHLLQDGLAFEPELALSDGNDGYACIRRLVSDAGKHLEAGGWLLFEHGYNQAEKCRALLAASGFDEIASMRDLAGIERVTAGRFAAPAQ